MPNFLCTTCGAQFAESPQPPAACPICDDPRQFVKPTGQGWITPERLRLTHFNTLKAKELGLIGIAGADRQTGLLLCLPRPVPAATTEAPFV
jgi:DNA-directed RNA polymerase subunit RPC12/RpoP